MHPDSPQIFQINPRFLSNLLISTGPHMSPSFPWSFPRKSFPRTHLAADQPWSTDCTRPQSFMHLLPINLALGSPTPKHPCVLPSQTPGHTLTSHTKLQIFLLQIPPRNPKLSLSLHPPTSQLLNIPFQSKIPPASQQKSSVSFQGPFHRLGMPRAVLASPSEADVRLFIFHPSRRTMVFYTTSDSSRDF